MQVPDDPLADRDDHPTAHVLLCGGRAGDRALVERAVRDLGPALAVRELPGGVGAAGQLRGVAAGRPAIVLIGAFDGGRSAVETVRALRADPGAVGVPVLVFGAFTTQAEVR